MLQLPAPNSAAPDPQYVIDGLQRRIRDLENQLRDVREALEEAHRENSDIIRSHARLRNQLGGLYDALRDLFGDLKDDGVGSVPTAVPSKMSAIWDRWKKELPGKPTEFIDALLEHGPQTAEQLVITMRTPRKQTIYDIASKLTKLGLLTKNGDKYALKELA